MWAASDLHTQTRRRRMTPADAMAAIVTELRNHKETK